jgi:glycerophosphoryl diester phosphodiesterase
MLDECVKILPILEQIRDACELLTGFYIETRYPPDIPDYTKEEIIIAFDNAKLVKEIIEEIAGQSKI